MRRATLLLIPLLAACGSGGGDGDGSAGPVQTADLTGLYEGQGEGEEQARMCMVTDPSGTVFFGIVSPGPDGGACSGAGEAVRQGEAVRLTMAGDEECVIEAGIEGTQVTLPASIPEACAYYCAPAASFAGESFEKTGGTAEDAMRATDLAGDPLCG